MGVYVPEKLEHKRPPNYVRNYVPNYVCNCVSNYVADYVHDCVRIWRGT